MGFSATFQPHITPACRHHYLKFCSTGVHDRHKILSFVTPVKCCAFHEINSVVGDRKSSINTNGAPEPARVLLERLFSQTQKLEEHMNSSSDFFQNANSGFNLENLESDLEAVLEALRTKEEDVEEAERRVALEHAELKRAREELECREKEVAVACSKQEKLEEELRQANLKLVSQARHIKDLKMRLKDRDQEIATAESSLMLKEEEMERMKRELIRKREEAAKTEAQLIAKSQLLDEANDVVEKQDIELRELRTALRAKQQEIEEMLFTQQLESENLKAAETKLEKQTTEWLLAQEELKKLGADLSKRIGESKETMQDFRRVKRLLSDVRSELVSSQKSLFTSRKKMEEQEMVLEKQMLELEEQKETIVTYMNSLKNAQVEVESERAKLRVAEARNKEFELDLSLKRNLLQDLQEELNNKKRFLQQAIAELSSLREELNTKTSEFEETNKLLEVKEKDLVEAKLEIQHLISEQKSREIILQERDIELRAAKTRLKEVNTVVAELKMILKKKEDQLTVANGMLKEKDDHAEVMQHDLDDARLMAYEAESVVGRIVDLTKELVISSKEDSLDASNELGEFPSPSFGKSAEDFKWQMKQLEDELELTRGNLRGKEMELLAAQRQLVIKHEELEMVLRRLEEKDLEVKELKEERVRNADDLKKLSVLAQESVGLKNLDDLAIEKLQIEAAQLEVEAATSALHKLAEMSRELLNKASLSIDADLEIDVFKQNGFSPKRCADEAKVFVQNGFESDSNMVESNDCLTEIKSEVARLSALTERLVQEAGATGAAT
ncbi:uncharacterized protein LOC130802416 [Amaranthus tricolor]|uniref:uncharacterized protein LOC130802416 n=1 Tax=Amaranthus tricolor TaxID=29722 RepID=UPI002584E80F|nr:uncharacterized protein LOC130802416 [Amaranthus tricolor]